MPATFSAAFGDTTLKRLRSLAKSRSVSATELIRDMIDVAWEREHPELRVGLWRFDVRGDVDEPICKDCSQVIAEGQDVFACLTSSYRIVAPLCAGCANTE